MLYPERAPTNAEITKWSAFVKRVDKLQLSAVANVLRSKNLDILTEFCLTWGIAAPKISNSWKSELASTMNDIGRLKRAIYLVEQMELGVRFEPDGEITIMAPPDYTKEQIESYGLGMWFVPIALGIIALGGVIARLIYLEGKEKELSSCQQVLDETEKDICADPNSEACQAWNERKDRSGYGQNETVIESIGKSLKEFGKIAAKGAGIGIAIALGLAVWKFMRK